MSELEISDLSIGDWVRWNDKTCRVCLIDGVSLTVELAEELGGTIEVAIDELSGIPLTPEILEKNGWLPPRKAIELDTWWWTNGTDTAIEANEYNGEWYLTIIEQKEIQYRNRVGIGLKYLHELQHALRLAGFEKEIEL